MRWQKSFLAAAHVKAAEGCTHVVPNRMPNFPVSFNLTEAVDVTNGPELTKGLLPTQTHSQAPSHVHASLFTYFF